MRILCLLPLALALFLAGCGKSSSGTGATNEAAASSPLTAPVDYLGAVGKAQQTAVKTIDLSSVQQAIQLFNADQGRYPKDLDELVSEKFLPRLPDLPHGMNWSYDPATGNVKALRQ